MDPVQNKRKKVKVSIKLNELIPQVEDVQEQIEEEPEPPIKQKKIQIKQQAKSQSPQRSDEQIQSLTVCFPDSIVSNAQSSELRSYYMSQLARMFGIFKVDEVMILRDYSYITKSNQFDAAAYIARNLQYLETPQYLRKHLFPLHPDLKNVGLMNPIECKHHFKIEDISNYREGVVVDRPSKDDSCWVEIGLKKQVKINYPLQPGTRVTVKLTDPEDKNLVGQAVSSTEPRQKEGIYWGYNSRIISKLEKIFINPQGQEYDFKILINIGEYQHFCNKSFEDKVIPHIKNKKVLVVFSGFNSVQNLIDNDEKARVLSFHIPQRQHPRNFKINLMRFLVSLTNNSVQSNQDWRYKSLK